MRYEKDDGHRGHGYPAYSGQPEFVLKGNNPKVLYGKALFYL
jgi:hypothetical protein